MNKEPNRMSTQDDPENLPWQNNELRVRGLLHPPKPNSHIQFYAESVIPAAWHEATVVLRGVSTTLTAGALTAHLDIKRGNTCVTPDSGSITMAPQHLEINVSENISVQDAGESPSRPSEPQAPDGLVVNISPSDSETPVGGGGPDWFTRLTWFIPKEIREPWRGDLLEDREKMAGEECSRFHIEWASVIQLMWLLLSRLWARIAWFWLIYTRLSEWFIHNK